MRDLNHLNEQLVKVLGSVDSARGLPSTLYVDARIASEERRRIFCNHWVGVGFAKDLTQPGDALPINFLGIPLLAIRTRQGDIRVFENVCRHRGMILLQK